MKHLLTDFQSQKNTGQSEFTASLLFEMYKDLPGLSSDFILGHFDEIANADPFILVKTGGERKVIKHPALPSSEEQEQSGDLAINLAFWSFSSILKNLNLFIEENIGQTELMETTDHPIIMLLKQQYIASSTERKAAIQLLLICHSAGLVLPFLLVCGKLSLSEYAKGVLSLHLRNQDSGEIAHDFSLNLPYTEIGNILEKKTDRNDLQFLFNEGAIVLDFLSYFQLPVSSERQTIEMIAAGESGTLEFKSTLRWDLRAGKTNPAVERAVLKTLCAFLNATGGTLIIGVRDDGSVEGVESDRLINDDRFLLHLWTLIRTCLGRDISPYIQTRLEKINDKGTICIVTCSPRTSPGFPTTARF